MDGLAMDDTYQPVSAADITHLELHHVDGWLPDAMRVYYISAALLIGVMVFWLLTCGQIGMQELWWGGLFLLVPAGGMLGRVACARGLRLIANEHGLQMDKSRVLPLARPLVAAWHTPWSEILRVDVRKVSLDSKSRELETFEMRILQRNGKVRRLRPIRWMPMEQVRTQPSKWALLNLPLAATPIGQAFKRFGPDIPMRNTH